MALTGFERRVRGYDEDEANIRREGRFADYQEGLQGQLDRQGAARMSARERRLAENAQIARGETGRFSSFERNALLGMQHTKNGDIALQDRQERRGLQDFEMARLRQQGENEFRVAEQKRLGMKEQGADAAGIHAKSELEKAQAEWDARQKIAGIEADTKKYGFDKDAEAKKYGFDKDAEAKKYGADATVDVATEQAKGALEVEKERGKTLREVEGIKQSGAVGVATQQARVAAAQQARKDNQNTEMLLQRERASLRKAHPGWTDEQIDAAARKNIGGESGGLDRFRK